MSDKPEKQISPADPHDANIADVTPVEEDGVAPIVHPGDHRNPNEPDLPLVSPIVDGGNL